MKKSLVLGILGLAVAAVTSYGQGYITLDNYTSNSGGNGPGFVQYGAGVAANGVSGALGTVGDGLNASWTVGIYFVVGTPSITDPAGNGIPNAGLALGSGTGSTAAVAADNVFGTPGTFLAINSFNISASGTPTITAEMVAYDSAASSYANAAFRGHSAPFTMGSATFNSPSHPLVGDSFTTFSVTPVPEPTTLALGALGGLALLAFRRKTA